MSLLKVSNLNFSYPSKKNVLNNINFEINEKSFTCILGENGSGKSTLLKCILGLNKGYTGKIDKERFIGYLPQKSEIQSSFPASVEEIVMSGTIGNDLRKIFYSKKNKEDTERVLKELEIESFRKKSFSELSGGQQQRVLIARALCATQKIIILDEPTNGLDPSIARQIYELLDKLKREKNITILMVSHDIDRALKYADHVIEVESGSIVFDGTPEEYAKGGKD